MSYSKDKNGVLHGDLALIDEALNIRILHHRSMWVALREQCESPIERAFLAAVYSVHITDPNPNGRRHLHFYYRPYDPAGPKDDVAGTHVYCQAPIGPYRADFLFEIVETDGARRLIVVECDGHDFHERNKARAAKDKARDRYMTARGIMVLRFTGSEIHRDPAKCWQEVWNAIHTLDRAA